MRLNIAVQPRPKCLFRIPALRRLIRVWPYPEFIGNSQNRLSYRRYLADHPGNSGWCDADFGKYATEHLLAHMYDDCRTLV